LLVEQPFKLSSAHLTLLSKEPDPFPNLSLVSLSQMLKRYLSTERPLQALSRDLTNSNDTPLREVNARLADDPFA
jgi:hypothetical protein